MKIKNFKISEKTAFKIAPFVLVSTLLTSTLTGCGEKNIDRNNLLKDTILENTCVVTFEDGSKDIAVAVSECLFSKYHHYYSVTSGEYFSDDPCSKDKIEDNIMNHYPIDKVEPLTLTPNEITKAIQDGLDNDDIIAIVNRTIGLNNEESVSYGK